MAGDEDRPEPGPMEPAVPVEAGPEAIPAREPSMAAGAADLATPDRPAESFGGGAMPDRDRPSLVAPPRRSAMPAVLSVIGIVLILLLAANLYTLYNPPGTDAVPALQQETAGLTNRVAALESRPPVDLGPLDARVKALAGDLGSLDARATSLAGDLAPLKAAVGRNADAGQAGAEAKAALVPLGAAVAALGQRLAGVQDTVGHLPKVDLGPVNAKLDGLATQVGHLDTGAAATDRRLVPLEAYFNAPKTPAQATEARQNGSAAETRAAPRAVIAQGILATIPTGRPFTTETQALARLGVDPSTLAPLQAVAATGAATDQDLAQGFAAVQDGIVVAAAPVSTGTMFDRIMANAQGVVKVSRTGAGAGEGSDAIASRIAADLKAGALPAAAAEWDTLPEASRARSADWAARLKARVAADRAARTIEDGAVTALAAAP